MIARYLKKDRCKIVNHPILPMRNSIDVFYIHLFSNLLMGQDTSQ
jgi:hypothetical protein